MVVPPDRKVTVPAGTPVVDGVTVALKVIDSPNSDGFSEVVNFVVVESASVTKETAVEMLVPKSVDPP